MPAERIAMTALHAPMLGLGYAPAREARDESERALGRALPVSFLLVTALLFAAAMASRLMPAPQVPVAGLQPHTFEITDILPLPPAAGSPVFHPHAAPELGRVPMAVPDNVPTPQVAPNGSTTRGQEGPTTTTTTGPTTGGETTGIGSGADPVPGVYVYTDQLPELVASPTPDYPDLAREAQVEGTVRLLALVDFDGRVKAVQVLRSIPLLDESACAAVKRWRFTPALANGHPVRVWVAVPVRFSLH
jgi:protein TonB